MQHFLYLKMWKRSPERWEIQQFPHYYSDFRWCYFQPLEYRHLWASIMAVTFLQSKVW